MGDRLRLPIVTRIGAAGRAKNWPLALSLWDATVKKTPAACAATVAACARSERWQRALDVLWAWFPAGSSRTSQGKTSKFLAPAPAKAAVQAASVARKWELSVAILEHVRPSDVAARISALSLTARSAQPGAAHQIFDETSFNKGQVPPELILAALRALEQVGDAPRLGAAVARLLPARGPLSKEAFNAAMSALVRGQQAASATQLWGEKDRVEHLDASSYSAYMQVAARQSEWEAALRLLAECKALGLMASSTSAAASPTTGEAAVFSSALSACGAAGRWTLAVQLLEEAKTSSVADVPCRNAAITALARSGLWPQALRLLEELGDSRTIVSWNATLTACAEAGEWRAALRLLAEMRQHETWPDTISYNTGIAACKNSGRWVEALVLLDELKASRSNTRNNTNESNNNNNNHSSTSTNNRANITSNSTANRTSGPDESSYTATLTALERGGRPELAKTLFWEAATAGGLRLTTPVLNAALMASSRAADWQQSLALLYLMEAQEIPKDRLTSRSFLRCMERTKRLREAAAALPLFAGWLDAEDIERLADLWEPHLWTEQPEVTASGEAIAASGEQVRSADLLQPSTKATSEAPPAATKTATTAPLEQRPAYQLPSSLRLPFDRRFGDQTVPGQVNLSQVRLAVERAIAGAEVWPLGSAAEQLMVGGSDVDATVILPGEEGQTRTFEESRALHQHVLRTLRPALATTEGVQVTGLITETRVPVLQLLLPGKVAADLSVENRHGCRKSSFVSEHLRWSPFGAELREACLGMKHWAKCRGVYGQVHGYPSGLGFVCLAMFAAQCADPQMAMVLNPAEVPPFAQEWFLKREADKELVGKLLQMIFTFYTEEFDWTTECVSVRLGRRTLRSKLSKSLSSGHLVTPPDVLSIEDPVQSDLDLGSPYMDAHRSAKLEWEFRLAAEHARAGRWDELFTPSELRPT